jgi:hypothetical protein
MFFLWQVLSLSGKLSLGQALGEALSGRRSGRCSFPGRFSRVGFLAVALSPAGFLRQVLSLADALSGRFSGIGFLGQMLSLAGSLEQAFLDRCSLSQTVFLS